MYNFNTVNKLKSVAHDSLELARGLRSAHAAEEIYDVSVALDHLISIFEELTKSGHEGVICLTEYCNAVRTQPHPIGLSEAVSLLALWCSCTADCGVRSARDVERVAAR